MKFTTVVKYSPRSLRGLAIILTITLSTSIPAHASGGSPEHALMDIQDEYFMRSLGLDDASQERRRILNELRQLRRDLDEERLRNLRRY